MKEQIQRVAGSLALTLGIPVLIIISAVAGILFCVEIYSIFEHTRDVVSELLALGHIFITITYLLCLGTMGAYRMLAVRRPRMPLPLSALFCTIELSCGITELILLYVLFMTAKATPSQFALALALLGILAGVAYLHHRIALKCRKPAACAPAPAAGKHR